MKSFNKILLLVAIVALELFSATNSSAQWGYSSNNGTRFRLNQDPIERARKRPFQRWGAGFNYVPLSGNVAYKTYDEYGDLDSIKTFPIKGWGAGINYSYVIPFAHAGEKALLGVFVGLNANYYMYSVDKVTFSRIDYNNQVTKVTYSDGIGANLMFALPVGIDLLLGGEATLDRANRFSFVVGGGAYPLFSMGGFNESVGAAFRAPGYVKAEIGFHQGINWKIRATYLTKSAISFDKDMDAVFGGNTGVTSSLQAKDQLMLSILVQPFSFKWQ